MVLKKALMFIPSFVAAVCSSLTTRQQNGGTKSSATLFARVANQLSSSVQIKKRNTDRRSTQHQFVVDWLSIEQLSL